MNLDKYIKEAADIEDRFEDSLQELGLQIRNEVVLPACKKHGLKFLSGNGNFFFQRDKEVYADVLDLPDNEVGKAIRPILELLNQAVTIGTFLTVSASPMFTEVTRHNHLGHYVGRVTD